MPSESFEGQIDCVTNHGSIVAVEVATDNGRLHPVYFEHRMFQHMFEAEGQDIVGRRCAIHHDQDGERLVLLDSTP